MEIVSVSGANPSLQELADLFCVSLTTIQQDVRVLVSLGYLGKRQRGERRAWKTLVKFATYQSTPDRGRCSP